MTEPKWLQRSGHGTVTATNAISAIDSSAWSNPWISTCRVQHMNKISTGAQRTVVEELISCWVAWFSMSRVKAAVSCGLLRCNSKLKLAFTIWLAGWLECRSSLDLRWVYVHLDCFNLLLTSTYFQEQLAKRELRYLSGDQLVMKVRANFLASGLNDRTLHSSTLL